MFWCNVTGRRYLVTIYVYPLKNTYLQRQLLVINCLVQKSFGPFCWDIAVVLIRSASKEALLMSTHNIHFLGEIRKIFLGYPSYLVLWITLSKSDEICPLAIPIHASTISMHISFGENPLIFTKVTVRKWKYRQMNVWQMDRQMYNRQLGTQRTNIKSLYPTTIIALNITISFVFPFN